MLRLAVLSNSPRAVHEIDRLAIGHFFEQVIPLDDPIRKPAPAAFTTGLAALDLAPQQATYVGDSPAADVRGARGAGLNAAWLDRWSDP